MIRDKLFRKGIGLSDETAIEKLKNAATVQLLKKGEMYIYRGEPEVQVGFLLSGGIKTFLIQENGSLYVNCLEARPYAPLLTNGSSAQAPALMNIQTIADTEILKVPAELVWQLKQESPQVAAAYDYWILRYLQEHQEHKQILCLPTEERLRWLLQKRPDLVQIASQKDIALFLNMTPERLSTVKKQLLEDEAFCAAIKNIRNG